tara:strand:+ start:34 stop:465 length:432 start_codon:yes stop_codon:yes gene_type:complete
MTQIYFYSGATNKLETTCRLCAKAVQQGLKVMIYTLDVTVIEQLDRLLWTFSQTSFVPHCHINDKLVRVTPVILSDKMEQVVCAEVLLNLHDACPPSFNQFQRLIEIAGSSHEDKLAARERYRLYQSEGYEVHHYKLDGNRAN